MQSQNKNICVGIDAAVTLVAVAEWLDCSGAVVSVEEHACTYVLNFVGRRHSHFRCSWAAKSHLGPSISGAHGKGSSDFSSG